MPRPLSQGLFPSVGTAPEGWRTCRAMAAPTTPHARAGEAAAACPEATHVTPTPVGCRLSRSNEQQPKFRVSPASRRKSPLRSQVLCHLLRPYFSSCSSCSFSFASRARSGKTRSCSHSSSGFAGRNSIACIAPPHEPLIPAKGAMPQEGVSAHSQRLWRWRQAPAPHRLRTLAEDSPRKSRFIAYATSAHSRPARSTPLNG